jgi:uncharacterized protein YceK
MAGVVRRYVRPVHIGVFFFSVGCSSIVKYQFGGEGETGQNVSDSSCSWIIRQIIILR